MPYRLLLAALVSLLVVVAPLRGQPGVPIEHKGAILCVAWSPNGQWLATGAQDGTIRVTEAATGKEVHRLATDHVVSGMAFAPDGKVLAIRQVGQTMSTWDLATGKRLKVGGFANYKADQLAFTPDGQMVVAAAPGELVCWKMNGGASGSKTGNVPDSGAAVAPDGSIGAWSDTKAVHLREFQQMNRTTTLPVAGAQCIALGPEGKLLAVGDAKGVHLWDRVAQKKNTSLTELQKPVAKVSISADGRTLAALADDGTSLRAWDLKDNRTRRQFTHNRGKVAALALAPNGKMLATVAVDGKAFLWNVATRELTHKGAALELSAKELAALWTDLGSSDAGKVEAAWQKIGAAGDNAVPFLQQQIRPIAVPAVNQKQIDKLLAELDDDSFATRERATQELLTVGEPAVVPLKRLLEKPPSVEAERRANLVLAKLSEPVVTPERLRVLEAIELLEQVRTAKALDLLKEIERDALIDQIRTEARQARERAARSREEKK